jgi:hypothetical protein
MPAVMIFASPTPAQPPVPRRTSRTVLATVGALVALCAPFVGCYVGFGDEVAVTSDCVQEGTNELACFDDNTTSISCVLTTPSGSALFAAGISLFYGAYTSSLLCFIGTLSIGKLVSCGLRLLLALQVIGVGMCALIPMVTALTERLHIIGFFLWTFFGTVAVVMLGIVAAITKLVDPMPYRNGMFELLFVKSVVGPLLLALCFLSGTPYREQTGPLFRTSEYAFLAFEVVTGARFVHLEAVNRF